MKKRTHPVGLNTSTAADSLVKKAKLIFPISREIHLQMTCRLYLQHVNITHLCADLEAAHIHIWELSDVFKNALKMNKQKLGTVC